MVKGKKTYTCSNPNCNKKFERYVCHVRGKTTYCSKKCQAEMYSLLYKGKNNPMYGRISPMSGRHQSESTRQKLREIHIGDRNPMFGRKGENSPLYNRPSSLRRKYYPSVRGKFICPNCGKGFERLWSNVRCERPCCSKECYNKIQVGSPEALERWREQNPTWREQAIKASTDYKNSHPNWKTDHSLWLKNWLLENPHIMDRQISYLIEYHRNNPDASRELWKDPGFREKHSGKNHYNWRGGISQEGYPFEFNRQLKYEIRKRDGFICQLCGITEENHKDKYHRVLLINHIDYNKENLNFSNLITVCLSCNSKVNQNRGYWTFYFQNLLAKKHGYNYN